MHNKVLTPPNIFGKLWISSAKYVLSLKEDLQENHAKIL